MTVPSSWSTSDCIKTRLNIFLLCSGRNSRALAFFSQNTKGWPNDQVCKGIPCLFLGLPFVLSVLGKYLSLSISWVIRSKIAPENFNIFSGGKKKIISVGLLPKKLFHWCDAFSILWFWRCFQNLDIFLSSSPSTASSPTVFSFLWHFALISRSCNGYSSLYL